MAVQLIMDVSASMNTTSAGTGTPTKYTLLRQSVPSLVEALGVSHNYSGILTFNGEVQNLVPLGQNTTTHMAAMNSAATGLPTSATPGNTNLAEGLMYGIDNLETVTGTVERDAVVVTDGAPAGSIAPLANESVLNLPALPTDARTGSDYLYRIYTGTFPRSVVRMDGQAQWQAGGNYALVSVDGLKANLFTASRLADPATGFPPASCGTVVPAPGG